MLGNEAETGLIEDFGLPVDRHANAQFSGLVIEGQPQLLYRGGGLGAALD
jgi:hypothetical protein